MRKTKFTDVCSRDESSLKLIFRDEFQSVLERVSFYLCYTVMKKKNQKLISYTGVVVNIWNDQM